MKTRTIPFLAVLAAGILPASVSEAAGPFQFYSVTPCRIVDTRGPTGITGGPALASNTTRNFPIVNRCGVPLTAQAAVLNLTIVGPTDNGNLIVWPYLVTPPNTSAINWSTADFAIGNGVIVPVANTGGFDISVFPNMPPTPGSVHLVIDVTGYFQ